MLNPMVTKPGEGKTTTMVKSMMKNNAKKNYDLKPGELESMLGLYFLMLGFVVSLLLRITVPFDTFYRFTVFCIMIIGLAFLLLSKYARSGTHS